jgi:site-specific DNA-cytosine methylase
MSGHFIPTYWNGGQLAECLTRKGNDQRMPDKNRFQAIITLQDISGRKKAQNGKGWSEGISYTLDQTGLQGVLAPTLTTNDPSRSPQASEVTQQVNAVYQSSMAVRRLTEVECERLQGFPDNYTNIKENCPSGARYKSLGNSMAVPVMKWIGERINDL